jgi:predicted nucleic-acid-binding protein
MIGLDTNILLRYIVKDDVAQWEKVTRFIANRCTIDDPGFIDRIALCEMVWVLTRGHGYRRADVVRVVRQLLASRELLLEDEGLVHTALQNYETAGIDFSDSLMAAVNLSHGCAATATFDRKAAKVSGFVELT